MKLRSDKPLLGKTVFFDLDDTLTLLEQKYRKAGRDFARLLRKEAGVKIPDKELILLAMEVDLAKSRSIGKNLLLRRDRFPASRVIAARLVLSGRATAGKIRMLSKTPYSERTSFLEREVGYLESMHKSFSDIPSGRLEREIERVLKGPLEREIYSVVSEALKPPWKERSGAFSAVRALREMGARCFVVTRGDRSVQRKKRLHFPELMELFPGSASFRVVPDGDKEREIGRILRTEKINPSGAFFVSDAFADMRSAERLGIRGVFVPIRGWKPFFDRIEGRHAGNFLKCRSMKQVPGKILASVGRKA